MSNLKKQSKTMNNTYRDGYNNNCEDHRDEPTHKSVCIKAQFVQTITFDIVTDLSDKNLVKKWYVKGAFLTVEFQDGTNKVFEASWEDENIYPNIVNVFSSDNQYDTEEEEEE